VNNRADRVARSEVFARFIVQDAAAHKHVIIGTNVSGFVGFAREALAQFLVETAPSRDLAGDLASRRQTVSDRLHKAWQRLKIGAATPEAAAMELASLSLPALSTTVLRALLAPIGPDETVEQGRRAVEMGVPSTYPAEGRPFVVESLARRRATAAVGLAVDRYLESEPARLDAIFSNAYRQLFEDQLVPLDDSNITGDAIIDVIARTAPPGTRIDIMGLQNIKGTGLDFVYRWVSLDAVERAIQKMRSTRPEERDEGLHELLTHNDWGLIDASHALRTLESLREGAPREQAAMFDAARTHIGPIEARHRHALGAARSRSVGELLRGLVGQTFDYLDSMRRQSMAKRVVDDLVASRISHAGAAIEMRAIVARAKGRWANKTSAS